MNETIYIDQNSMEGAIGLILKLGTEVVYAGLEVLTEEDSPTVTEFSRLCGVNFFLRGAAPEVPLYAVPYLEVFAADGQGGWFALTQAGVRGPVYHIAPDLTVHLAAESQKAFLDLAAANPDWRQKRLPGNWPSLPEDPDARRRLAETLHLPIPAEERGEAALPRIFPSRAEAEKEYPIMDIWTILRQEKKPRFQVHPMMSPADREGRAFVHYQAWQETYSGLMPDRVLSAHTLERCRKNASDRRYAGSTNTFVALDRENGDQVVGFGTLSYHGRDFVSVPDAGEITALYVLREFQGYGIGRKLLESCLAWIPRPRTALFVLKGNERAIGFYEHMGFHFTGHELLRDGITELEMVREKNAT